MSDWHLQICHREWVVWWYGPREDGNGHIAPALTVLKLPGEELEIAFSLPEHRPESRLPPPQELRRVTCWGWRVRTNDGIHDTCWYLADTRESALEAAQAWENRDPRRRTRVMHDVREYAHGLW